MRFLQFRCLRRPGLVLALFLLSSLLTACAGEPAATANSASTPRPWRPNPTITVSGPANDPTVEPPTAAPVAPTVTPLSSPSPLPQIETAAIIPTPTPGSNPTSGPVGAVQGGEDDAPALSDEVTGSVAQAPLTDSLQLARLPRLNGLPRLPVTKAAAVQTKTPPLKTNYGLQGQPRVGVQVGHWQSEALPDELASLRTQTGGHGGGVTEVSQMLDLSRRVVKMLQDRGIQADLLPATVPVGYTADAFIALHADAAPSGTGPGGYKAARARFSAIPLTDDAFMNAVYEAYGKATGLRRDSNITRNMTGYYAFNSRRHLHAVSKVTPAIILETGYLTYPGDLALILNSKDTLARGIADGIVNFLDSRPALEGREKAVTSVRGAEVLREDTPLLAQPDGAPIAYVGKGQQFEYYETKGDYYTVYVTALNKPAYLRRSDATPITLPR